MAKTRRGPADYRGSGDEQTMMEAVACLILRGGVMQVTVDPAERSSLYERFPHGFGLVALSEGASGRLTVTVTGEEFSAGLTDVQREMDRGGTPSLPPYFKAGN